MGVFLVGCVIASYWTVSTTLVFTNKKLVNLIGIQSDFSLFIVWFQCLIGALFLFLASTLSRKFKSSWSDLNSLHLVKKKLMALNILISSLAFVAALIFNSVLLKYISVSFYQIARSLTIIFVLIMSVVVLQERFMLRNLLACSLIICGFYLGVHEELYNYGVHIQGVFYGVVTSLFSALSSTLCKTLHRKNSVSSLQITYYVFTIGCISLTPIILLTSQAQSFLLLPLVSSLSFWFHILLSGLCCLLVGWISTLQISLTSPLAYIISTNSKSVFQTLLAVLWNSETRSWLWWMGNFLVMTGILLYTVFSFKKEKTKPVEIIIKDSRRTD